jgi:secreted trypsin-like serine protease
MRTWRQAATVVALVVAGAAWAQRPMVSNPAPPPDAEATVAGADDEADSGRIIGGRNALSGELPFQVQIYYLDPDQPKAKGVQLWQQAHRCGGALIAPDWVLTAAHCFFFGKKEPGEVTLDRMPTEWFGVRAGTVGITSAAGGGVTSEAAEIRIHPGYVPCDRCPTVGGAAAEGAYAKMFTHDIALVRLKRPLPLSDKVETVPLFDPARDRPLVSGRQVTASGWGLASNAASTELAVLGAVQAQGGNSLVRAQPEPILQVAALETVPCTGEGVLPTHFCAGGRSGADTCMGDSGGPLVLRRPEGLVLVGITSRRPLGEPLCGKGKTRAQVETRYSRVDGDHAAWIAKELARRP